MTTIEKITAINRIEQFKRENDLDDESMASIISLLEDMGVEIDACSGCGAMPMQTNCNNARCQDND
mgnify:CR=1 FL=1